MCMCVCMCVLLAELKKPFSCCSFAIIWRRRFFEYVQAFSYRTACTLLAWLCPHFLRKFYFLNFLYEKEGVILVKSF